jgi:hypothetical protein
VTDATFFVNARQTSRTHSDGGEWNVIVDGTKMLYHTRAPNIISLVWVIALSNNHVRVVIPFERFCDEKIAPARARAALV